MGRPRCCTYTTRCYDLSGNTVWKASYYRSAQSSGGATVNSQVTDGSTVYVAGGRVVAGGTSWNIIAFDLLTGEKLWTRDVWIDVGSPSQNNGIVVQLQINPSGNIVAMLNALYFSPLGAPNFTYLGKTQYFAVIAPSGSLVTTYSFSLSNVSGIAPTNVLPAPIGFTIDASGGYHILACNCLGNTFQEGWGFYYGTPPFSSAPTYSNVSPYLASYTFGPTGSGGSGFTSQYQLLPLSIARIGDADYVGGVSQNGYNGIYTLLNPGLIKGKSQTAAMSSTADIDTFWPKFAQSLTTSATTDPSNATGVSQAAAYAMSVGNRYMFGPPFANSFKCAILPSGSADDCIAVHTGSNMALTVFPPVGGKITVFDGVTGLPTQDYTLSPTVMNLQFASNPVHIDLATNAGQYIPRDTTWVYYVCLGGDNWGAYVQSASVMNSSFLATRWIQNILRNAPSVDASGNLFSTTYMNVGSGELVKYDASGIFQWYRGTGNIWTSTDLSGNVYSIGYRGGSSTYPSIVARDTDGNYLWGHAHHGFLSAGFGATAYLNNGVPFGANFALVPNPSSTIQVVDSESYLICSGQLAHPANDNNFVSNPWTP